MNKELVYLKGFSKGLGNENTLIAISYADKLHSGQYRKSLNNEGKPEDYIIHPSRVTKQLVNLGIHDDVTLSIAILHDVLEDCKITREELNYIFPLDICRGIELLTKNNNISEEEYLKNILKCQNATLVKISDRCHNISTMAGAFTKDKINQYIEETEKYYIPMCKEAINLYPKYSDAIYSMKLTIEAVINALKVSLNF